MNKAAAKAEKISMVVKKFVTLGLGEEKYGIEVGKTREIIARYEIVPLPKTPDFIEGIISLRGDIIPVVDLRKRFELESKARGEETRVIVVELREFTVGIQVDSVFEVLKLSEGDIEPPPPLVSGLKADYLEGVAEINEHLITILNLEKIFSTNEKVMLSELEEEEEAVATKTTAPKKKTATKETETSSAVTVDDAGMVDFRGKSYFVGKKHAGAEVELSEAGGKLTVLKGDKKLKGFDV